MHCTEVIVVIESLWGSVGHGIVMMCMLSQSQACLSLTVCSVFQSTHLLLESCAQFELCVRVGAEG